MGEEQPCPACGALCNPGLVDILRRALYVRRDALEHLARTHPEIAAALEALAEPRSPAQ